MAKFIATYQSWKIEIAENGTVSVYDNGTLCENSKKALCEIAGQVGFVMQENWNTRQMGRK